MNQNFRFTVACASAAVALALGTAAPYSASAATIPVTVLDAFNILDTESVNTLGVAPGDSIFLVRRRNSWAIFA